MSQSGDPTGSDVVNPEEIKCRGISTVELDSDIESVLKQFRERGQETNFGVLLITSLPASRPRANTAKHELEPASWSVIKTISKTRTKECFILKEFKEEMGQTWPTDMEKESLQAATVTGPEFWRNFESEVPPGQQSTALPATGALRKFLNLKSFPVTHGMTLLQKVSSLAGCSGLGEASIKLYTNGSLTKVHSSVAELGTIIYHHRGAPQHWLVVPPTEKAKLEDCIRKIFSEDLKGVRECSQFVEHLSLFLTPKFLKSWGIKFFQVRLEEREIVIIFPSSYFWGFSTGSAVLESRYINGPQWDFENYRFCKVDEGLCRGSDKSLVNISRQHFEQAIIAESNSKAAQATMKARKIARKANRAAGKAAASAMAPNPGEGSSHQLVEQDDESIVPASTVPQDSSRSPGDAGTNDDQGSSAHHSAQDQDEEPEAGQDNGVTYGEVENKSRSELESENHLLRHEITSLRHTIGELETLSDMQAIHLQSYAAQQPTGPARGLQAELRARGHQIVRLEAERYVRNQVIEHLETSVQERNTYIEVLEADREHQGEFIDSLGTKLQARDEKIVELQNDLADGKRTQDLLISQLARHVPTPAGSQPPTRESSED